MPKGKGLGQLKLSFNNLSLETATMPPNVKDILIAGRKNSFTVICQSQNCTSIPKTIVRNIHYFLLFRLNDNISINNIIRNHNTDNVDKETFKKLYLDATAEPLNFFMLDLRGKPETRLRKNFTQFYKV